MDPYAYVTITTRPDKPTHVSVSFRTIKLRADSWVTEDGKPGFDLTALGGSVTVSTSGPVTDQDVTIAREIFNAAARYLADCERLHNEAKAA